MSQNPKFFSRILAGILFTDVEESLSMWAMRWDMGFRAINNEPNPFHEMGPIHQNVKIALVGCAAESAWPTPKSPFLLAIHWSRKVESSAHPLTLHTSSSSDNAFSSQTSIMSNYFLVFQFSKPISPSSITSFSLIPLHPFFFFFNSQSKNKIK